MSSSAKVRSRAKQLKGRPVCITLHDGRSYMGWITGIDKEGLTLSGQRTHRTSKKNSRSRSKKATVSGLMPLFGSLLGNTGGLSGFGGFLGMMQKAIPVVQMGYKMIKTIMPLMGGIKGLMA